MTWRPGLRASIALILVLTTVGATAAMGFAVYHLQAGSARDRFVNSALIGFRSDIRQATQYRAPCDLGPADCRAYSLDSYMSGRLGITWALVDLIPGTKRTSGKRDGHYLPSMGRTGMRAGQLPVAEIDRALAANGAPVTYSYRDGNGSYFVVAGKATGGFVLAEFYSTGQLDREVSRLRGQLLLIAAAVTVVAAVIGILAARRIQRPVRTAATAARRLGAGALDTRLEVHGSDELAELAGSFNTMAQRLGESIEELRRKDIQQRRFVADVAHDLRTPMASLLALTENLDNPDTRERSLELLDTQIRRLSALVEDLLEISRFDAGVAEFRPEPIDLTELVTDAAELTEAGVTIDSVGRTALHGDPRRLHTIVRNLLANAKAHGAPPITVTIDGSAAEQVSVTVADSGPGIPEELTGVLFDRFVRGDRTRSHTEGSGLGLAIAGENAALHGGRITVHNAPGAVFTLTVARRIATEP